MPRKPSQSAPKTLRETFPERPDPRVVARGVYLLHDVLRIAGCGLLGGGASLDDREDFAAEREGWPRGFLALPGGLARHDTFNRVFQARGPRAFAECFARWRPVQMQTWEAGPGRRATRRFWPSANLAWFAAARGGKTSAASESVSSRAQSPANPRAPRGATP